MSEVPPDFGKLIPLFAPVRFVSMDKPGRGVVVGYATIHDEVHNQSRFLYVVRLEANLQGFIQQKNGGNDQIFVGTVVADPSALEPNEANNETAPV